MCTCPSALMASLLPARSTIVDEIAHIFGKLNEIDFSLTQAAKPCYRVLSFDASLNLFFVPKSEISTLKRSSCLRKQIGAHSAERTAPKPRNMGQKFKLRSCASPLAKLPARARNPTILSKWP
eukprot:848081-Pleurochrysis_carterae.AAC.1